MSWFEWNWVWVVNFPSLVIDKGYGYFAQISRWLNKSLISKDLSNRQRNIIFTKFRRLQMATQQLFNKIRAIFERSVYSHTTTQQNQSKDMIKLKKTSKREHQSSDRVWEEKRKKEWKLTVKLKWEQIPRAWSSIASVIRFWWASMAAVNAGTSRSPVDQNRRRVDM